MAINIGDSAPGFELANQFGEKVTLSSFKGKKSVVLVFFPFAFTGTCTAELCALGDDLSAFQNENVELLAISCDAMYTQKVFAEKEGYNFPLLSDFWPHGAVAMKYGVFDSDRGLALRGTFIIDKAGIVRWRVVNSPAEARKIEDYRSALASL
ncbi:MAG: peroxiredoxin [Actinobacteria bacterium]|nr:peroxiredoxin [Actinomycetota bacterium]